MGELQGKRDDGGFAVMTASSTSATFCDFGGGGCSSGGCGGCGGGCGGWIVDKIWFFPKIYCIDIYFFIVFAKI